MTPTKRLQEGIYLRPSVPAPAGWRVLLLDVVEGTTPGVAREAVSEVMRMLADLQQGIVRELPATRPDEPPQAVPPDTFKFLLGYGASFWRHERHKPRLTTAARPAHLTHLRRDGPAFPSLPWGDRGGEGDPGEADLLLQFTGISEHAVDRAAVEVWKVIQDQELPLQVAGSYDGFQRDDGRSWIGFHDGVNNIEPSQRRAAIECNGNPDWNRGGTYLAFLRIEVALKPWRALSRTEQEILVGRDKLTGCPLESASVENGELHARAMAACPPTESSDWQASDAHFNPPETPDRLIEASHTHRANQNRVAGTTPAGHRIFRQGYEYLDGFTAGHPRLGLNFISFQNDLLHLHQILGLEGWLGDVNFGGPTDPKPGEPAPVRLLTLRAGGLYAAPPRQEPFPGADLFAV